MTRAEEVAKFLALKAVWEHRTDIAREAVDHAEQVEADFSTPFEEHTRRIDAAIRAARRALQIRESAKSELVGFIRSVAKRRGLMSESAIRLYFGEECIR